MDKKDKKPLKANIFQLVWILIKSEVQPYNQFLKHNCGGSKSQCRPRCGGAKRQETPSYDFYTRRNSLTHFYHCQKSNAYFKFWSLPTRHQYQYLCLNLHYIIKSLEFIKDIKSAFGSLGYNCVLQYYIQCTNGSG